jgi:diguanylate cyclase (GGDEF)-like protein/PAS domain S-box-containing protein
MADGVPGESEDAAGPQDGQASYAGRGAFELLSDIAIACNEATSIEEAMQFAVDRVCSFIDWPVGHVYTVERETDELVSLGIWHLSDSNRFEAFKQASSDYRFARRVGLPGRVLASGRHEGIVDVQVDPNFPRAPAARQVGLRGALGFPVIAHRSCVAVFEFFSAETWIPDTGLLDLLAPIGVQVGRVVERNWAQHDLANLGRRMEVLLTSAGEGIYGVDRDGFTTFVNPSAAHMLGWQAQELIGRPIHAVVHGRGASDEHHPISECPLHPTAPGTEGARFAEDFFRRRDGSSLAVQYICSPIHEADGTNGAVVTFSDITERQRLEERLRYLADHDALTGLFNRRRFVAELERQVAYSARYPQPWAALMLDLDRFKYVNDTLGHHIGDELLRSVAGALRSRLRDTDVIARLGGDEFAVVLPKSEASQAELVAAELAEAIRRLAVSSGQTPVRVTASVGVTVQGERELTAAEVLVEADVAMYQAKAAGRDRHAVYSAEAEEVSGASGLSWADRIRRSLERDEFVLHAQPILDLASGSISQFELLLRMRGDREGELILPGEFLPPAERFGLIREIDRWVIRNAIALIADRRQLGREPQVLVAVNLSGSAVGDEDLHDLIRTELDAHGIPPSSLMFEITETAALAEMEEAKSFATRLALMGCRLALDDFGTGFGSFYYLKYLPLDYLKIDADFITGLVRSTVDQRIVTAIVEVARVLGIRTIAEFVTDAETMELLRTLRVDYAQGYFIGQPAPIAQVWGHGNDASPGHRRR